VTRQTDPARRPKGKALSCVSKYLVYPLRMTEQEMTLQEIENQFQDEWVLVGDPETTDTLEVIKGKILHHSRDRDEVYRRAVALRPKRSAILFTGQMPANTAIVL